MFVPRPFPEEHTVPSLQLLCASYFDTTTLDKCNLSHLHLPPANYVAPPLILLSFNKSIIMYTCEYNNFVTKYTNMMTTKYIKFTELCTMIDMLDIIKPATTYSERYKNYVFERVGGASGLDSKFYLPIDKPFIVLQNHKNIIEFLKNLRDLISIINYVAEIVLHAPFMHKRIVREYVDKCKTSHLKKYIDYFYIILDRLCYENGIVTNCLITKNILPLTVRTIIYYLAPKEFSGHEPDLKQDTSFVSDPYLPCKCFKGNDLIILRRNPDKFLCDK